jgi:hypothetical protein
MLKGGLHCHTTRSDGALTPEEVMVIHKEHGYDFLAITDHRCYNFKNFLPELGLTILPGMEFDNGFGLEDPYGLRAYHTVCIGPSKEDGNGYEQDERPAPAKTVVPTDYQPYLDEIRRRKNLAVYCHPEWSGTPARLFDSHRGYFAMEIWNSGSAMGMDMDKDAPYWDELLGSGIRIFGVATDDGHEKEQHCKGWVMVNAENNISSILSSLEKGAFYSSTGPEIYDFYVDGDKVFIDCSDVATIRLHSDGHPTKLVRAGDAPLNHAEFSIMDWCGGYAYARMSIIDKDGRIAWTNPIFLR